jgi:hypothetical protein
MPAYPGKRRIRIFNFTQFAKPLTDAITANLKIDYVGKKNFRKKEDRVKGRPEGAGMPTWCLFRLPFSCNGRNWLARQLGRYRIGYIPLDNAWL